MLYCVILCTRSEYFTTRNCVFNFNFLAVVVSEIIGGPKLTSLVASFFYLFTACIFHLLVYFFTVVYMQLLVQYEIYEPLYNNW